MPAKIEYRLLSLDFYGIRPKVVFSGAYIGHGQSAEIATVEGRKGFSGRPTSPARVLAIAEAMAGREVQAIRYQIIALDPRTGRRLAAPVNFCHDVPKSARLRLRVGSAGTVYLARDGFRRFFSKNYDLRERMNNPTLPDQAVYQFHE